MSALTPGRREQVENFLERFASVLGKEDFHVLYDAFAAAEQRAEKADAALTLAVEGLRRTHVRLACGREGELEDEVDEALSIIEETLETLGKGAVLEGREEKPND